MIAAGLIATQGWILAGTQEFANPAASQGNTIQAGIEEESEIINSEQEGADEIVALKMYFFVLLFQIKE